MSRRLEPGVVSPSGKKRSGKGFSMAELIGAGLSLDLAHRMHLPVDKRRSSSREENIAALKGISSQAEPAGKTRKKVTESKKRVEEKVPAAPKLAEETKVQETKALKRKRTRAPSVAAKGTTRTAKSAEPQKQKSATKKRKSEGSKSKE